MSDDTKKHISPLPPILNLCREALQDEVLAIAAALQARKIARSNQYKNQTRQQTTLYDPYTLTYQLAILT